MRAGNTTVFLLSLFFLAVTAGCKNSGNAHKVPDTGTHNYGVDSVDTNKHYFVIDSGFTMEPVITQKEIEQFKKVKNLLEFHTKDSMKTDSTYIATLAMGKNISPAEMELKIKPMAEPDGKVQVRDTTQEVSLRMSATLEDKASVKNPNFLIELIGGENNIRHYDSNKNKMVWQWNVTPLKAGNYELILSISQLDSLGYVAGSPETRRHYITIFSEGSKGGFGRSVGGFFEKNWQWLVGAVLVPLLIVCLNIKHRAKVQQSASEESSKPVNNNWKRKKRR